MANYEVMVNVGKSPVRKQWTKYINPKPWDMMRKMEENVGNTDGNVLYALTTNIYGMYYEKKSTTVMKAYLEKILQLSWQCLYFSY